MATSERSASNQTSASETAYWRISGPYLVSHAVTGFYEALRRGDEITIDSYMENSCSNFPLRILRQIRKDCETIVFLEYLGREARKRGIVPEISRLTKPQNERERIQQRLDNKRQRVWREIEKDLKWAGMLESVIPYTFWGRVAPGYEKREEGVINLREACGARRRAADLAYIKALRTEGLYKESELERKDLGLVVHRD